MDKCHLTLEQVWDLMAGRTVRASYSTFEEYGRVDQHEMELVPPTKVETDNENNRS